ncbi:MAG: hypothetical protein B9S32_16565 [Verrucomicrobia bacterium Tous-C9LFEB]|nr:MAG: hypothetical protein B9S32_16565 [Verrucomicrobia bacterium Tous-C9LFEB]
MNKGLDLLKGVAVLAFLVGLMFFPFPAGASPQRDLSVFNLFVSSGSYFDLSLCFFGAGIVLSVICWFASRRRIKPRS